MRALLEELAAAQPLVLILDDLHWADDGTAELLDHLLRHPPRGPVLLALAHRPRQTPGRLRHALARAAQDGLAELVELSALSPLDASALLPDSLSADRRQELYAASDGNPFYLQALAAAGTNTGGAAAAGEDSDGTIPAAVRAALAGELAGLTGVELLVAQAAAVVGDVVAAELAARTADLDLADGARRARRAWPGATWSGPTRPAAASGSAIRWSATPRTRGPRRAGGSPPTPGPPRRYCERGAPAVDRAHHVERSATRGDTEAVGVLREAAAATMHSTPATAAHWLEAALRLLPDDAASAMARLDLLGMRARALGVTGRLWESRDALHELLGLLPAAFAEPRAQVVAFAATIERLVGRHVEARAALLAELATLADQHGPAALALKLGLATGVLMRSDLDRGQDWSGAALETARRVRRPGPAGRRAGDDRHGRPHHGHRRRAHRRPAGRGRRADRRPAGRRPRAWPGGDRLALRGRDEPRAVPRRRAATSSGRWRWPAPPARAT